jgi:large subunit ribosomal protein L10
MSTEVAEKKGRAGAGQGPSPVKEAQVAAIREKISDASSAILFDFRGLTVMQMADLRRRTREAGVELSVVKNNLLRRAVEGTSFEPIQDHLKGPVSLAIAQGDPAAPAKAVSDFLKEVKIGQITGGILDGEFLDEAKIKALADLPPREVLLGQLVGVMDAQVASLPRLLNAIITKLLYAFQAIAKEKENG